LILCAFVVDLIDMQHEVHAIEIDLARNGDGGEHERALIARGTAHRSEYFSHVGQYVIECDSLPSLHGRCVPAIVNSSTSKVPEITLVFWIIKIAATTLGETGGDSVSMSMNLGYLVGTAIFAVIFIAAVAIQVAVRRFHPLPYWFAIIASTTVGTTLADYADRSLGIGYAGGTALLGALLVASLFTWYRTLGSISVATVSSPRAEGFYWLTIMFSQTLGTALGDWTADTAGLGYVGGAVIFTSLLALVVAAKYLTRLSRTWLFWLAFVLTRPLGAVVGDLLDKPIANGGMALSRYAASAALLAFIVVCVVIFPQRPAHQAH
jgi:uncharacterized membrane-anchored protein